MNSKQQHGRARGVVRARGGAWSGDSEIVGARGAGAVDRRRALAAVSLVGAGLVGQPAKAFLGLGEDAGAVYAEQTQKMIDDIKNALEVEANTDAREEAMKVVKDESVAWVSRYRRDPKFSGRPSFSLMYSAVNAIDGQLVSFGLKANLPKKRLDRMMKSIADAERQLQRGR